MRKLILTFVLGTLCLGAFSQEAFYIYRNDGDFNGFFYDEVVEMRQSKIGVDSVEYDKWVTQEIVLADTIYRIPLAAIDSIGFQQPEIKINPRVKFMEQEGLCPYVDYASEFGVTFVNLPAHLKPQVGDVLIGLPTDDIAKEKYEEGSFSCIVDDLYTDGDVTYVSGHAIEQLSDVFEQYITVEQIGVDQQGNIHRRIAGCTPDGFPRAKIRQVSGDAELTLINFESTFTRSWNPTDNSAIELSAQIGLVVKFRAAFNVTWTRFMASLSQDMVIKTKPALAMSAFAGFEFDSGELLPCKEILFPAACPIFGINPIPSLFLRGEGKLEAKLNMPQVRLGVGQHYTIDSNSWFPVSLGLHLVPDENKEVPADMLDLSGQVAFSGYVQTGMKFSGDIFTASWIKKIFRFALGTYLYAGPKVSGEFVVSADIPTEEGQEWAPTDTYETLEQSQLNVALISLDLEAKGHFSVFSKEGEKKFFDKNWSFLTDTISYTPQIKSMDAIVSEDSTSVRLRLNVGQGHTLGYCWAEIGIFKPGQDEPIKKIGMFDLSRVTEEQAREGFSVVCPYDDLKAQSYFAVPIVHIGGAGEFVLDKFRTGFVPPFRLEILSGSSLTFGAKDGLTQIVSIKTNALKESILIDPGNALWIDINWKEDYEYITVVDEKEGRYDIAIKAYKNLSLFDREEKGERAPFILLVGGPKADKMFPIEVYQAAPDLSSVRVDGGGWFHAGDSSSHGAYYYGDVTASRSDNTVTIDGTYTENYENGGSKSAQTHTIHLLIEQTNENGDPNEGNFRSRKRICSGWVKEHEVYSDYNSNESQWKTTMVIDSELHFSDSKGWQPEGAEEEYVSGKVTSGQYDCEHYQTSSSDKHDTMASGAESYVVFHITIK